MTKPSIKEREKNILSEDEFRENTMGCFYQDELRAHDNAIRKIISQSRQEVVEEERKRITEILEARLELCKEHNGLPYCKNCGLNDDDIQAINPIN